MARLIWRLRHWSHHKDLWDGYLSRSLDLEDRLGAMIDRCLKRLLFARGVKSVSSAPASGKSLRLLAPTNAA
jgi:hypothetical protein